MQEKQVGVGGEKNRCLPLHVPDNDDLDATALASSPELNTHTQTHTSKHKAQQPHFPLFQTDSFCSIRNSQWENGYHQISFGYKSDGSPMDVTTALGRQTGHKGSERFKTQQSAHWDYMHYRTGYEIASSHKLVLIHVAHYQCSCRIAKVHCEANSLSVREPTNQQFLFKEEAFLAWLHGQKAKKSPDRTAWPKITLLKTDMEAWCDYEGRYSGGALWL